MSQMRRTLCQSQAGHWVVIPEVSEEWPVEFRNAIALRNASAYWGFCPACGAASVPDYQPRARALTPLRMAHEPWCEARDEAICAAWPDWLTIDEEEPS